MSCLTHLECPFYIVWQHTTGVPNSNLANVHACCFREYILGMALPSIGRPSNIFVVQTFWILCMLGICCSINLFQYPILSSLMWFDFQKMRCWTFCKVLYKNMLSDWLKQHHDHSFCHKCRLLHSCFWLKSNLLYWFLWQQATEKDRSTMSELSCYRWKTRSWAHSA